MYRIRLECTSNECTYGCVVSNAVHAVIERMKPEECPRCGSNLIETRP